MILKKINQVKNLGFNFSSPRETCRAVSIFQVEYLSNQESLKLECCMIFESLKTHEFYIR